MSGKAKGGVGGKKRRIADAKRRSNVVALLLVAVAVSVVGVGAWYAVGYILSSPRGGGEHQSGQIVMHIHPKLTIRILGQNFVIPANIGMDRSLWLSHKYDAYGMSGQYPLHTHDESGTIHVESTVVKDYTLGDFFDVWGVSFGSQCMLEYCNDGTHTVKMYVNGRQNYEFRTLVLRDGQEILIEYS